MIISSVISKGLGTELLCGLENLLLNYIVMVPEGLQGLFLNVLMAVRFKFAKCWKSKPLPIKDDCVNEVKDLSKLIRLTE